LIWQGPINVFLDMLIKVSPLFFAVVIIVIIVLLKRKKEKRRMVMRLRAEGEL